MTALDEDGSVEWCQLPIHAALTYKAPLSVIQKLVEIFPKSVRCADDADSKSSSLKETKNFDNGFYAHISNSLRYIYLELTTAAIPFVSFVWMICTWLFLSKVLPLHYAFRFGAEDGVLVLLLEKFPQALCKKAINDRLPLTLAHYGPRSDLGRIVDRYIANSIQDAREVWEEEYDNMFKHLRSSADTAIYHELQMTKASLAKTQNLLAQATEEIALLKEQQAATESENEQRASRITNTSMYDTQKVVHFPGFKPSGVGSYLPQESVTATIAPNTSTAADVSSIQSAPRQAKKKNTFFPFGRRKKQIA